MWKNLDTCHPAEGQTVYATDGEGLELVTWRCGAWEIERVIRRCNYAFTEWRA